MYIHVYFVYYEGLFFTHFRKHSSTDLAPMLSVDKIFEALDNKDFILGFVMKMMSAKNI